MKSRISPLRKLVEFGQSWHSHTRDGAARYAATMTQVEALRVEVSALEAEIRRTERSGQSPAYKDARIRGLASRAAESYGRMLCLLREAADIYPAVLTERLDIPHRFSEKERRQIVQLPERPPSLGRLEVGVLVAAGVAFVLVVMLLSKLYPVVPMAGPH